MARRWKGAKRFLASGAAAPYRLPAMTRDSSLGRSTTPPQTSLKDLSPSQWKSGIAAWLGWLFDGLDLHLYTLVATAFVTLLLGYTGDLDKLAKAKCPHCFRRAYSAEAVDLEFGYRTMGDGTVRVQSWCRVCRKAQLRGQTEKSVVLYNKAAFGIPVGMSPTQFRKLWLRLSKGRTVLQVMLDDSMKDLLNGQWQEQSFSWTTKKKD